MYQAFYRKWRPQVFDDVCGQEHITSILKYETEHTKFSHAYLFCGSRGTGKTTCAKILAKAVNCLSPINGNPCNQCAACRSIDEGTATDVLEMDAASNNGVDNVRDIRDEVVYTPSALKYRVYIVDEVHMLSTSAFNALLKTLEEPPAHAIFILATTELHKLPSTIISRCQRYDFRRIGTDALVGRLEYIAKKENIEYETGALRIIARMAQGGMRDAISLLELCAGSREKISTELVNTTLGVGGRGTAERIARAIAESDFEAIFETVDTIVRSSKDISVFWQDLISFYRDMLVIKTTREAKSYLDLTDDETERLVDIAKLFTKETLIYHSRILDETLYSIKQTGFARRTAAETALIRMCDTSLDTTAEALLSRISKLEAALASGSFAQVSATAPTSDVPKKDKRADGKPISDAKPKQEAKAVETKATATDVPMLKSIRGWAEVVETACGQNPSVIGFLKMGRAFVVDGERIEVRFSSDFIIPIVNKPDVTEAVAATLTQKLSRKISASDIKFTVLVGNEREDELDELDVN